MLQALLATLRSRSSNDQTSTRRSHPRRDQDRCVVVIMGRTFPVENWSVGGLLLTADDRLFSVGNNVELTLKFKLRNTILDISHSGNVIRKGNNRIALQFDPVTQAVRKTFQQVIDDYVAREFAQSQV